MTLFTIGPVQMYGRTRMVASRQLPYFRDQDFSAVMLRIEANLKRLINAPESSRAILLTASGTGAMEAAVMNLFDSSDKLLIIDGGSFGHRFCDMCTLHGIPHESVVLQFGETLSEKHLRQFDNAGFTGLLVNIHETSTGQLYSLDMLSKFCKHNHLLFVVDAISAFLADEFDFSFYGVDAAITSSQKALSLSPGLSAVVLGKRIIDERISRINPHSMYFDFKRALADSARGQTPFTPAVGIILELDDMLCSIENAAVSVAQTKSLADYFRGQLHDLNVTIPNMPLSNALTPIFMQNGAKRIYNELKTRDLIVTPSGGEFADSLIRIGHLGNLCTKDYDMLLKALQEII